MVVAAVAMEVGDTVAAAEADEVVVSSFDPLSPPFHQLMELTRSLVGGFTSGGNAAPLGGGRRW